MNTSPFWLYARAQCGGQITALFRRLICLIYTNISPIMPLLAILWLQLLIRGIIVSWTRRTWANCEWQRVFYSAFRKLIKKLLFSPIPPSGLYLGAWNFVGSKCCLGDVNYCSLLCFLCRVSFACFLHWFLNVCATKVKGVHVNTVTPGWIWSSTRSCTLGVN